MEEYCTYWKVNRIIRENVHEKNHARGKISLVFTFKLLFELLVIHPTLKAINITNKNTNVSIKLRK